MKIIHGNMEKGLMEGGTACALGFFDGVHKGHQNLISRLLNISSKYGLKSMVFTFEKHPMTVIMKSNAPKLITNNDQKAKIFEELGVDIVNFNNVDRDFLNNEPEEFLSDILVKKFNVKAIVAGFNFKFGHLGKGDYRLLEQFGKANDIIVSIVNPVYIDGMIVSSTAIRDFIRNGNIAMANKFLGRCFSLEGSVIHGMERGRKIGFPTANIAVDEDAAIPKNGVYITEAELDGVRRIGITNVGFNPTFNNSFISIETHILDFHEDIYGKHLTVYFHERIRDERPFDGIDGLSAQIDGDRQKAIEYFNKINKK